MDVESVIADRYTGWAHPEDAYAFNELSLTCCETQGKTIELLALLDMARAWRMHEASPLISRLKEANELEALGRGKFHDKIVVLLHSTVNRRPVFRDADLKVVWRGLPARGFTAAISLRGWALSWPCGCPAWSSEMIECPMPDSNSVECRHIGSVDHVLLHWQRASRSAKVRAGRPTSVRRIDDALNGARGEVPQVHSKDGSALNIDGVWKHGMRVLSSTERKRLSSVGWVLPR